jgi:predicted MFS family arabinose efflux permease
LSGRISPALRLAAAGALSIGAAVGIGRFVYTPILPQMMAALTLTRGETGWIASANFAGYLLGALIATAPIFARAPRLWLIGGLLMSAVTTGAMGVTTSLPLFLALRGLGGVASAFVLVFASTLVLQRLAREGRGGLSAVHFAGVGCAIVLSALATTAMEAAGFDWRALWLMSGGLTLLGLVAVLWLLPADDAAEVNAAAPIVAKPTRRGSLSLMLAYGLFGFGYVVTATFIVAIVKTYPAAAPVRPFVWLLVGAASIPSVAMWTAVGGRIGVRQAFAAACGVEALGVAVSVLRPTADGAVIASVLLGGTYMGITALGLVAARETEPDNASRVLGRMTAAFGLGQMIGPAFAGWLAERLGGFGPASLIASVALLAAAALTFRPLR